MCAVFKFSSLYETLEKRRSLSLTLTHTQRAARDDDFSPYSFFLVRVFACVCKREISYSAGKIFYGEVC